MPFNRLVRTVDDWALASGRQDVFAQIGATDWQPAHIAWSKFLQPPEFARRFAEAEVVVAHAGMGTILSALQWEKPILVMPRRASLGEQRNEHQLATATAPFGVGQDQRRHGRDRIAGDAGSASTSSAPGRRSVPMRAIH